MSAIPVTITASSGQPIQIGTIDSVTGIFTKTLLTLMAGIGPGGVATGIATDSAGHVLTTDGNGAAYQGVIPFVPGTPQAAQRSVGYECTTGGNVTLTLADGSTITLAILPSTTSTVFQTLPFAVTNVVLGNGTVANFWNLK